MFIFHLLKFQVALCLFFVQLPDTVIRHLHFFLLRRPHLFFFRAKLLHQFLLLAANLRIPDIHPRLLTIFECPEVGIQFVEQQPVLTHYILIGPCQFRFHIPYLLQFLFQQLFARYPFDDFFNLHLLVMQSFLAYPFEQTVYDTYIRNQAIMFLVVFLLQFAHKPQQPFAFRLRLGQFFLYQRNLMQIPLFREVKLRTPFADLLLRINQIPIGVHYFPRHFPDRHLSILVLRKPKHHIPVFLFEFLNLAAIKVQIYRDVLIAHRTDNGIFYEIGIQLGIQKDVLYRPRDILVFGAFHNGKLAVGYHFMFTVVAENDVTVHLIACHLGGVLNLRSQTFADACPLGMYHIALVDKPLFLKRRIDKAEKHPPLRFGCHHTIGPILPHHLIDNVRIGVREVKGIEALLLFRDAEFQLVCIVKEKYGTK